MRTSSISNFCGGEKTRNREILPLFGAGRKLGCAELLVVTDHESETVLLPRRKIWYNVRNQ